MLCMSVLFDESANIVMPSPQRCPDNSVADPEISDENVSFHLWGWI